MKSRKKVEPDLNYLIIKDRHNKSIIRKILYSRIVLIGLLLLIQFVILVLFFSRFRQYNDYYFICSIISSTLFMIYLSNCKGKNEFKIAWLVPVVIFPLLGISVYLLYHFNTGGTKVRRRIKKLKAKTRTVLADKKEAALVLENYPEIKGLGTYLMNQGDFLPFEKNRLSYYPSGEDFLPDFFNAIKRAKEFIFIEFFIIDVDESWSLILEVLEQKVQEGVEVRVLFDGFGSMMAASSSYQNYLLKKGIKTRLFLPLTPVFSTQMNNRDHRKIVVVDGKVAFTGGVNIANEYFNEGDNRFAYWKDNAVKVEGPAIQTLTQLFLQTWNIQTKTDSDFERYVKLPYQTYESKGVTIPYGDDAYNNEDIAEDIYLQIITNAKKYIYITTPYVIIDNQMKEALIFAAQKGVDVKIIVPSEPDHFIAFCIGKTFIKDLIDNGVKVFLYEKGFIHAKTFICDDEIATVGSVNLDYRSFFHHFECGVVLYKTEITDEIKEDFVTTLDDCAEMKKEDYKKIPAIERMTGRLFRVFAPLM